MGTRYQTDRGPSPVLGLVLDAPPWEIPKRAFVIARNVRTQDKIIQTLGGKLKITTAADGMPVSFIGLPTFNGNNQVGVVGTNQHLYQLANAALNALNAAPYNAPPGTPWEMALLLDTAYFLQPSDPIQVFQDGVNNVIPLAATAGSVLGVPGSPRGYTMSDYYDHLLVGNIVGPNPPFIPSSQNIIGSGLGNAQLWDIANINGESRSFLVPFGNYPVRAIRKLGDYLVVYKSDSIAILAYNPGTATVYSQETVDGAEGACGNQVVVVVASQSGNNDQHYRIGQNDIYMFDGADHPIGHRIWDDFKQQVKPLTWTQIVGWYHRLAKEVYWGFASVTGNGSIDTALVYDILDDCFYYRDWPFTAGGYMLNGLIGQDRWIDHPEDWPQILPAGRPWVTVSGLEDLAPFVGDPNGNLFQYEATPIPDFAALVQTGLDDGGDDGYYKTWNGMRLDLSGLTPGVPFNIFGRGLDELSEYDTKPFQQLASLKGGSRADFYLTGRWAQWQFQCAAGGTFMLGDYEPRYVKRGLR